MGNKHKIMLVVPFAGIGLMVASYMLKQDDYYTRASLSIAGMLFLVLPTLAFYHDLIKSNHFIRKVKAEQREREAELKRLQETMRRFIPPTLLQCMDADDFNDLSLGKQTQLKAVILTMDTMEYDRLIRVMKTNEIFTFINDISAIVVPILSRHGVVSKFTNNGMTALFMNRNQDALDAALLLCKEIDKENKKRREKDLELIEPSIGISEGPVMIGLVGVKERMELSTLSQYTGLSLHLQQISKRYDIRILTTSTFINGVRNADRIYDFRFIGYLYIRSLDSVEKLYDVYEEDAWEVKGCKKKTKLFFERGVKLYTEGRYEDARLHFIEVLKNYRMDKVAKQYLNLCEQKKENIYFEAY